MKKLGFIFSLLFSSAALAQTGTVANHAVPVGQGVGVSGFRSAGPCAAGQVLIWSGGATADPTCGASSVTPGGVNGNIQYNNAGSFGGLTDAQVGARISASDIASGTLAAARGGAGTINGALKGNGAGVVSQAACADLSGAATSCSTDTTNAANISSGQLGSLSRLPSIGSNTVLGNNTGGSAAPSALTPSQVLDIIGSTRGSILYRGATGWAILTPGASGQVLKSNGAGADPSWVAVSGATAPTRQTFTSGSGTYTTPASTLYLRIRMCGGGGGGAGSGSAGGNGGNGGNTTFGAAFLTANGGTGATFAGTATSGPNGGTATGGDLNFSGQNGGGNSEVLAAAAGTLPGPMGGNSAFFAGGGSGGGNNGAAAVTNSGGGGQGGGGSTTQLNQISGAAGGCLEKIVTSPSATYAYAVGAAGPGGAAGSVGSGGPGAAGIIIVEEFY